MKVLFLQMSQSVFLPEVHLDRYTYHLQSMGALHDFTIFFFFLGGGGYTTFMTQTGQQDREETAAHSVLSMP
jgi:hypothetical protein